MKRFFSYLTLFFLLSQLSFNSLQKQEKLQEEVTVTAAEVPVRVIYKGQPVKNLTKEDFELYENGVKQEITAFEVISRKMSNPQEIHQLEGKIGSKKRIFILIFNIFDYNDAVGEAIDYFFQNFFGPECWLIVVVEDRLLNIERGKSLDETILKLKETLKKYKHISILNTYRAYEKLNMEAERLLARLRSNAQTGTTSIHRAILNFYENYLNTWIEYRKQYLYPDLALYESITERVKQMEGEKWAICFQQREMFPKLKHQSSLGSKINEYIDGQISPIEQMNARFVRAKQMEMQRSFDISSGFPAEAIKNLFMDANITFHLVLLKSLRTLASQDFELREVAQDYEACFKDISLSTGGFLAFSNKVSEALEEASQKEDYHYLLVYNPKENQSIKKRNIEVKVKKEGAKVIHLKQFSTKTRQAIAIADFKSDKKSIKFSLISYERIKIKKKLKGIANIKITLYDDNSNKVFEDQKTLELIKKDTYISLNLDRLKSGSHFIIIQVIDKISQRTDVFSRTINL